MEPGRRGANKRANSEDLSPPPFLVHLGGRGRVVFLDSLLPIFSLFYFSLFFFPLLLLLLLRFHRLAFTFSIRDSNPFSNSSQQGKVFDYSRMFDVPGIVETWSIDRF